RLLAENEQLKKKVEELTKQLEEAGPGAPTEITITVWAIGPDEPSVYRFEAFKVAAEKLNKMLEDIGSPVRVKIEGDFWTQSWGDYKKRFLMAMEADKGPDIYCTGHEDIAYLAENNYIISLDDYVQEYWDIVYFDIIPVLWNAVKYKGKIWAIPQDTEVRLLYFRKDILRKLGWTDKEIEELPIKIEKGEFMIEDMVTVARQAVNAGLVKYGLVHKTTCETDYQQFYLAYNGRLWDPESGKLVFTKSAWKKFLKLFERMRNEEIVDPNQIGNSKKIAYYDRFAQGKTLFASGNIWDKAEWINNYGITEDYFWKNIGFALHPTGKKGDKPVTLSYSMVYTITKSCENKKIAFLLITLVTDPTINSLHAISSTHLAILSSQITNTKYKENKFLVELTYMLNYTTFIPLHPRYELYNEIICSVLKDVENGKYNAEEAFEVFLREVQEMLDDEVIIED
ncbi:MAG: sugar ABC transporter substrate-binding protein, partial [Thermoprotei archaeon]